MESMCLPRVTETAPAVGNWVAARGSGDGFAWIPELSAGERRGIGLRGGAEPPGFAPGSARARGRARRKRARARGSGRRAMGPRGVSRDAARGRRFFFVFCFGFVLCFIVNEKLIYQFLYDACITYIYDKGLFAVVRS